MPNGKKQVLNKIQITEISVVDQPAQPDAQAVIMKRNPVGGKKVVGKNVYMTTAHDGHQHVIDLKDWDGNPVSGGMTSYAESGDGEEYHSHPWVIGVNGQLEIGMALGHKHEIDSVSKRDQPNGEKSMKIKKNLLETAANVAGLIAKFGTAEASSWGDDEHTAIRKAAVALDITGMLPDDGPLALKKADMEDEDDEAKKKREKAEEAQKQVEKRLARAEAIADMTSIQKTHFDGLDKDDQAAFIKMDGDARDDAIKKANEDDPVIATIDGIEIRKSAPAAMVAMAKRLKKLESEAAIEKAASRDARIEKRASDLDKLPGSDEVRKAVIGAIMDFEDKDLREEAFEMLKAANDRNDGDFTTRGAISKADADDAETKLNKMAKSIQKDEPGLTIQQAFNKALATDEGRNLYKKMKSYEDDDE